MATPKNIRIFNGISDMQIENSVTYGKCSKISNTWKERTP